MIFLVHLYLNYVCIVQMHSSEKLSYIDRESNSYEVYLIRRYKMNENFL